MKPNAVTDSTFDAAVLRASEPVLVDFWAEWCGPCRMIGPFLEDLATDMAGKLTVAKVNIDENPQNSDEIRGARDPDDDPFQRRAGCRDQDWCAAQEQALRVGRVGTVGTCEGIIAARSRVHPSNRRAAGCR